MIFFWFMGERLPFESLRDPVLALLGTMLIFGSLLQDYWLQWTPYFIGLTLLASLVSASIYTHNYFAIRADPDWDAVRSWARLNSRKSDLFLNAGQGGNFRTNALRSSTGEEESALAWVDPIQFLENSKRHLAAQQGLNSGVWDLDFLLNLADDWGAEYIILDQPADQNNLKPVFHSGVYNMFEVP